MNFIWPHLEQYFSGPVISTLLSADESGRIKIPDGTGPEAKSALENIANLQTMGFVNRRKEDCHSFILTEEGRTFKSLVMAENKDASDCAPALQAFAGAA